MDIWDCELDIDGASASGNNAVTVGIATRINGTTTNIHNTKIIVDNSSGTGTVIGIHADSGTTNSYHNVIDATGNTKYWAQVGSGDTLNTFSDQISDGTLNNSGTANVYSTTTSGDLYVYGDCSALTFTDRTPFYEGDALTEISKIKGKAGKIDHSTLPEFAKARKQGKAITEKQVIDGKEQDVVIGYEEVIERNIGNMVSVNVKAIQQLIYKINTLEAEIEQLKNR